MIDPVAIQLGPISIRWYAICIVTGLVLAVYLAMKEAPRRKIIPDDILDFILIAFPVAILGALDIAAPSVMIAQSIGRWGNFANHEAYGAAVKSLDYLPSFIRENMYIEGSYRQPTFLYESVWNLIGFILIIVLRRRPKLLRQGEIAAFYLIWYGFGRMIIEGMRTDSLMFAGLRVSQWLSLILIFVGIGIIIYQRKKKAPYYQE